MLELVRLKVLWCKELKVLDVWTCVDVIVEEVIGFGAVRYIPNWDETSGLRGEDALSWGEVTHWLC